MQTLCARHAIKRMLTGSPVFMPTTFCEYYYCGDLLVPVARIADVQRAAAGLVFLSGTRFVPQIS
jgi:hypothetical protein